MHDVFMRQAALVNDLYDFGIVRLLPDRSEILTGFPQNMVLPRAGVRILPLADGRRAQSVNMSGANMIVR